LSTLAPAPPIHALPLHDALPIYPARRVRTHRHVGPLLEAELADVEVQGPVLVADEDGRALDVRDHGVSSCAPPAYGGARRAGFSDRKSTRLNSSHGSISYAVFCL